MSAPGTPRISDERLGDALTRQPDATRMAVDLVAIVRAAERTRQGRPPTPRWLLLAAVLMLALVAVLAVVLAGALLHVRRVALVAVDVGRQVWVANADGSGRRLLTSGPESNWEPRWSPDGTRLAYWSTDPVEPSNTCGLTCVAAPRRLVVLDMRAQGAPRTSVVTTVSNLSGWRITWAPDSRRLVVGDVVDDVRRIFVIDVDSLARVEIGGPDLDGWDPTWSPDGRHIAFVRGHQDLKIRGLYVMDPDGSHMRRLTTITSRGAGFLVPAWSPAGDRLAFAAETGGADPFQKDIWVVGLDGSPEVDVSNDPADEGEPDWAPDGSLAFVREIAPGRHVYHVVVTRADGTGGARVLAPVVGDMTAEWSPDSRLILAAAADTSAGSAGHVIAIDIQSGATVVVADGQADGVGSWQSIAP